MTNEFRNVKNEEAVELVEELSKLQGNFGIIYVFAMFVGSSVLFTLFGILLIMLKLEKGATFAFIASGMSLFSLVKTLFSLSKSKLKTKTA